LENILERGVPIPLYYQICQYLRREIETGNVKPGQQIPTESQLQQIFQVSRATVRRAISDLAYEGLVERRRSKGTIVAHTKLEETLYGLASFTNSILKLKLTPQSRILDFRTIHAVGNVATHLKLNDEEEVVAMKRLRLVDGQPVGVEDWFAPAKYVPGIDQSLFKEAGIEQSTYFMLKEHYGIQLMKATDTMSAVALGKDDAELLRRGRNMPALLRARVSYNAAGVPVTYGVGRYIMTLIINFERNAYE
jgi:GntR family transcriptional regulator